MSNQIRVGKSWLPYDPNGDCRNFYQNDAGTQARMPNHVVAMQALEQSANHMLGQCPRVMFTHGITVAQAKDANYVSSEPSQGAPLLQWRLYDGVPNGRTRSFRAVILLRGVDPGTNTESYFVRTDNGGAVASPEGPRSVIAVGPEAVAVAEETGEFARGANPDALKTEGLGTFNGHRVLDLVVQDEPLDYLDTADNDYVPPAPSAGQPVLGGSFYNTLRTKFHALRVSNRKLVGTWSGHALAGAYSTAMTAGYGDFRGIHVTSTSLVNLFDQSITARAASSPGMWCHANSCGIGTPTLHADAKKLKVRLYAFAYSTGSNGTIQIEGSSTFASNTASATFAAAAAPAWHDVGAVYLDTRVADDDTGTTCAKLDVFGKVAAGASHLYIYGLAAFSEYGL